MNTRCPMRCRLVLGAALLLQVAGVLRADGPPLVWDATAKEHIAGVGEETAHFTFAVTNTSSQDTVTINRVSTSCGCTLAKLPAQPWRLAPGDSGQISVDVDLRGKMGMLTKSVSFDATPAVSPLIVKVTVSQEAYNAMMSRMRNQQLAVADRQAVFKNDCATCHAAPALGKTGAALFAAACGVCHDTPHRASMVPDLRAPKNPTNKDYWRLWITKGKPGSLMPAFAQADGGPLTDAQIDSLVVYLDQAIPSPTQVSGNSTAPKLP